MSALTPQEYAAKWQQRTKNAVPEYKAGVNKVTRAPGAAAAARADAMLAGVQDAVTSGKWARKVSAVSLEDWRSKTANVGAGRISAGVDAAAPAQVQMAEKLLATINASVAALQATPRGNLETNIGRAVTHMRYMADHPIT